LLRGEHLRDQLNPIQSGATGSSDDAELERTRQFAADFLDLAARSRDGLADAALGCPGAVGFVRSTAAVCEHLPVLSIPSNGLLYTIAKRQFLDGMRSARAEERFRAELQGTVAETPVLEELSLDVSSDTTGCQSDSPAAHRESSPLPCSGDFPSDVAADYRAFLEFLRIPLTRAEGALAIASRRGSATAERVRVDSWRAKYDRLLAVLCALSLSPQPSEEEIGSRLGLTRNQVKYAIERIRAEFNRFFPELARDAQGRRKRQGAELP
jgi:hypothetical protein